MPRKPRLEYKNAFYHVMNRGRRREMIFHDEEYYQKFIDLLKDVHERFGCVIHCYCLMGNKLNGSVPFLFITNTIT